MRGLIKLLRLAVVGKNCDDDDDNNGSLGSGFAILRKPMKRIKFMRLCFCEKLSCY